MYSLVDQPVSRLTTGSRFILDAMRGWVLSAMQNRCPAVTLAPSFSQTGMLPVLGEFHSLMLGLHRQGRLRMAFGDFRQIRITEIEAILLALWTDAAADRGERARLVLELLVVERAVEGALACMGRITTHMAMLGFAPSGLEGARPRRTDDARRSR